MNVQDDERWSSPCIPGLLGLSIAALAGQILMVRIFSFTMNHGFVYMAVSLAMLGFGLSGTVLTIFPSLKRRDIGASLQLCSSGFALTLVGTMFVFARFSSSASPDSGLTIFSPLAARLLLLALPFGFAGLGIALALLCQSRGVGVRYAWNLAGSGLGCLVAYPVLTSVGAAGGIFLLAGLVFLAASFGGPRLGRGVMIVLGISFLSIIPMADELLAFQPDQADQLADLVRHMENDGLSANDMRLEFSAWDPVGRIEVHSLPGEYGFMNREAPLRFYSQDAGAGSVLLSLAEHPKLRESLTKGTLYGLATRFAQGGDVLVIGIGGAPDLIATLAAGAKSVSAVEINGATVTMVEEDQAKFLGLEEDLRSKRLKLIHADGRGFVRRHPATYDVIQMTGADTYAANPAGASILSEGYLYTKEAFGDYLAALKPGGVLAVTRFGIESARVFNTAYAALKDAGFTNPRNHLAVVAQGNSEFWSTVLMTKDELSDEEIKRLYVLCQEGKKLAKDCWIPAYNAVGFRFDSPLEVTFQPKLPIDLEAMRKKLEGDEWHLEPVTDDRPFFFQFQKREGLGWNDVFTSKSFNKHHWDLPDYLRIAVQVSLVALLLILLPLIKIGFGGAPKKEILCVGIGFVALGTGFMFLEVVLMQRCTLFLGHPNHAIVIVLFALLVFSGLGSLVSAKWPWSRMLLVTLAILGILVWVWVFRSHSQEWFESRLSLSLSNRAWQLLFWLAPLGLLLGMPFPSFLESLESHCPSLSGWAWGSNSFASVCASLIAIPVAMESGFGFSFTLAMGSYGVALVAIIAFMRLSQTRL